MKFRGIECKGWVVISKPSGVELSIELNKYMEKYEFLDCQFSVDARSYNALVLLGETNGSRKNK